jgi:glycosyltransferase involved in cell wall biosynthesis
MKVALVHDYLVDAGGAERALLELHRVFPDAPIYTSIYSPPTTMPEFVGCDLRTSFLQILRPTRRDYKRLLPLYPIAFASLDLSSYDVIVSSSSGFSKCIRPRVSAAHVCYCYTPPRFLYRWHGYREQERLGSPTSRLVAGIRPYLQWWDQTGARRVDRFVAISETVRDRIAQSYSRPAAVVYPPIELDGVRVSLHRDDFYLIASRLLPYKRIDTAVEAFTNLGRPLVVVGDGPDRARLEAMSGPTVSFRGRVSESALQDLYQRCRATVVPGEEDLGLTPLEANAAGAPVIALGLGGARETVISNVTGVLYPEPTVSALTQAVSKFETIRFDVGSVRRHAERFSRNRFRQGILAAVEEARALRGSG